MNISIRDFEKKDINKKIEWINDPLNNRYLHYDLPLELKKTLEWFENNRNKNRYDGVIEVNGEAVGLLGLISIDIVSKSAEYYILIGNRDFLGKGVAKKASLMLLDKGFEELKLERVYLSTEADNLDAQYLYQSLGFQKTEKERMNSNIIYFEMLKDNYYGNL